MRRKILLSVILSVFVLSLTFSLPAQEKEDNKTFSGKLRFGYRVVDTSGADSKYKEDINLDKGARLFNFSLNFTPDGKLKNVLDRLDLNVYNFGGDPYETFGLSVQKYGKYKFQYDRKKSTYFYEDVHEAAGHLYDFHTFSFDRVSDSASLKVWLGKNASLYMNYDRYTKEGESTTTFDINRIEFEFDQPIREKSTVVSLGLDVHLKNASFVLEEKVDDYKNTNSLFLPGYADGGASARYPSSLSLFYVNQPYDFRTYTHTLKFNARPISNLLVAGSARLSEMDMDLSYSEAANGVTYLNRSFAYSMSGNGEFDRKIQLLDLDISYLLFNNLAIIGAVRYNDFEQNGSFTIDGEEESATLKYDTVSFEGGLQYQFSPKFSLTLGYRNEARELEGVETVTYEEKTQRNGAFGTLKMQFSRAFMLGIDFQRGWYDDPFTLISPTDFKRLKATAKIHVKQFDASCSYLLNDSESDVYDERWESTKKQFNSRLGFHGEKVNLFAGYSHINVKHKGDRTVEYRPSWTGGGSFLWEILYEGKSNLFDASISANLNSAWRIGAYGNIYSNKGFWEISRTTLKGYLEYAFEGGYITQVGYRYVDFKEKSSDAGFNDYKAHIFEISFGYRWE
ncbi:MAG: hypothetical protein JSV96_09125 [Candidatus Aminicenantes bacterium]|nr:MAG: hypothetical protein JSV96_09125 [Candidatus Aminicenantes bacterium]